MGTVGGVGTSHNHDPHAAGREAVEQALKSAGITKPDLILMFATIGYDQPAVLAAVRKAAGGAPVCGCSAEGTIARDEVDESLFSIVVMAIASDELRFDIGLVSGLKADSAEVGRTIAKTIQPLLKSDTLGLFIFPDGLTINFEQLQAGIEDHLKLDRLFPLLGGTAGDDFAMKQTYQYCNDQVVSDGVAWALILGRARLAWAVNHSCLPMGVQHTVTRSEKNVIYEIDGRPALDFVKNYLTEEEIANWGKAAGHVSFGIEAPGDIEEEYDRYLIRFMPAKDDQTGSITIPTEISEGTVIWMTRRDYDKMAAGVDRLGSQIKAQLGGATPKLIFQFDCGGRGKIFLRDQQRLQLLGRLQRQLPFSPWLGFYTFGEIAPIGGHNCFHNYTAIVVAIY